MFLIFSQNVENDKEFAELVILELLTWTKKSIKVRFNKINLESMNNLDEFYKRMTEIVLLVQNERKKKLNPKS